MRDFSRLDAFLDQCVGDVFPDPPMQPAIRFTEQAIEWLVVAGVLTSCSKVLDVGAGAGLAFNAMRSIGVNVTGIDLAPQFEGVIKADQSFLPFEADQFDGVWARHVLEHSPMPFFTLTEYARVLKAGGWCYVEVPAQNTDCRHEENRNHYSVLGEAMWLNLMRRAGFEDNIARRDFIFSIEQSDKTKRDDKYLIFMMRKKA